MSLPVQFETCDQKLVPDWQANEIYETRQFSEIVTLQRWMKWLKIGFLFSIMLHVLQVGFLTNLAVKHEIKETETVAQTYTVNADPIREMDAQVVAGIAGKASGAQTGTPEEQGTDGSGSTEAGSVYIRYGKQTCPGNGTDLIYPGYVGGSHFSQSGAAVNYLCLPTDPLWGFYDITMGSGALLYGGEYQFSAKTQKSSEFFGRNLFNQDAVCAVCLSRRPNHLMIPGRNKCYPGWTKEYSGYLTAGHVNHAAASEYACLDADPEYRNNSYANANGVLFYLVRASCGSLPCPPYVKDRQIACVVCTK